MARLCHNQHEIATSLSPFTWLHFLAILRKAPPNSKPYRFRKKEVRLRVRTPDARRVGQRRPQGRNAGREDSRSQRCSGVLEITYLLTSISPSKSPRSPR